MTSIPPQMEPSPQTTLVILLGASAWPFSKLPSSPAFARSACKVRDYFCHSHRFGLPPQNWLDLFDTRGSPNEVDLAIGTFLDERIASLKQMGTPARDLLFYYIGHGVFAYGHDLAYHLAIHSTRDESLRASAIAMAALADTLKAKARHLRRIVILDCCFAAESLSYMQSAPDQVALQQTIFAFKEKSTGHGIPRKGTSLLCSSGPQEPSFILPDHSGTMFSEALVRALTLGNTHRLDKVHLCLHEIKDLIEATLEDLAEGKAPRPLLHSPDQSNGDVAFVPFFPNPPAEAERLRKATEAEQKRLQQVQDVEEQQSPKQMGERLPSLQRGSPNPTTPKLTPYLPKLSVEETRVPSARSDAPAILEPTTPTSSLRDNLLAPMVLDASTPAPPTRVAPPPHELLLPTEATRTSSPPFRPDTRVTVKSAKPGGSRRFVWR